MPLRLVGRDPSRLPALPGAVAAPAAEYADTAAMRQALEGVRTLFLVSARESAERVAEHLSAVDAAVGAGVERVVYLSFLGAAPECTFTFGRDHWHTEQHLRSTGLRHTFLRDSLYADLLPQMVGDDGAIRGPAADGRLSAVSQDDVAAVATAVLLDDAGGVSQHDGVTYDVTGPQALTMTEVAATLSAAWGRPVRYVDETEDEAYASRARFGAPDFEVAGWVSSYLAIARGELSLVSDAVPRLIGRAAKSFGDVVRETGG